MTIKEIFFSSVEEFNNTVQCPKNRNRKYTDVMLRGMFYTTLRRNLGENMTHLHTRLRPDHLSVTFREDNTLEHATVHPSYQLGWYNEEIGILGRIMQEFSSLGRTKEQLELCDIVNTLKTYKY